VKKVGNGSIQATLIEERGRIDGLYAELGDARIAAMISGADSAALRAQLALLTGPERRPWWRRPGSPLACIPRSRMSVRSRARGPKTVPRHGDLPRRSFVDFSLGAGRDCGRYRDQGRKLGFAIAAACRV
jgi:hypothetical protein